MVPANPDDESLPVPLLVLDGKWSFHKPDSSDYAVADHIPSPCFHVFQSNGGRENDGTER
jgi:hypothetical protein